MAWRVCVTSSAIQMVPASRGGVDRAAAQARPHDRAVAPAEGVLALLVQAAGGQHRIGFRHQRLVIVGGEEDVSRTQAAHVGIGIVEHLADARIAGLELAGQREDDADRRVFQDGVLVAQGDAQHLVFEIAGVRRQRLVSRGVACCELELAGVSVHGS